MVNDQCVFIDIAETFAVKLSTCNHSFFHSFIHSINQSIPFDLHDSHDSQDSHDQSIPFDLHDSQDSHDSHHTIHTYQQLLCSAASPPLVAATIPLSPSLNGCPQHCHPCTMVWGGTFHTQCIPHSAHIGVYIVMYIGVYMGCLEVLRCICGVYTCITKCT